MRSRLLIAALAVPAALNVAAGIVLGVARPVRTIDVITMWEWSRTWLLGSQDLYAAPASLANYPPHAIVFFSPIALIPAGWAVPAWTACNVALSIAMPLVVAATTNAGATAERRAVATLLFLCWASVRNLAQFSELSMTLAFLAVMLAGSRPVASGVTLAIALVKPHVAAPLALWLVATRHVRVVVIAAAAIGAGAAVYSIHANSNMWEDASGYAHILHRMYTGPDALYGRTNLQPWIVGATGPRWGDALWIAAVLLLLIVPCAMTFLNRRHRDPACDAIIRAAFCVWALLSFFQLAYSFVLFLPAFMVFVLVEHPPTRRERWIAAGVLTTALTVDLPVRLAPFLPAGPILTLVENLDRVLAVATFLYLVTLWTRFIRIAQYPEAFAFAQSRG